MKYFLKKDSLQKLSPLRIEGIGFGALGASGVHHTLFAKNQHHLLPQSPFAPVAHSPLDDKVFFRSQLQLPSSV
jgi:hypothetical protein